MTKPILYLVRGERVWMLSLRAIPEDEGLTPDSGPSLPTIVPTPFARDLDMERVLRAVGQGTGGAPTGESQLPHGCRIGRLPPGW